ncbi:hypothetical protein BDV96DRAFT_650483 [Lophiotrema nucula]|uniref:Uncharacterized protein n=1 Tax=Lophiotrema nucula TaxID=690887 RepID=A0A6A5YUQ2_9PLEO|nr:hypothetical protein BDV96DRAFT_650483 [Lophiotrema nucula]
MNFLALLIVCATAIALAVPDSSTDPALTIGATLDTTSVATFNLTTAIEAGVLPDDFCGIAAEKSGGRDPSEMMRQPRDCQEVLGPPHFGVHSGYVYTWLCDCWLYKDPGCQRPVLTSGHSNGLAVTFELKDMGVIWYKCYSNRKTR